MHTAGSAFLMFHPPHLFMVAKNVCFCVCVCLCVCMCVCLFVYALRYHLQCCLSTSGFGLWVLWTPHLISIFMMRLLLHHKSQAGVGPSVWERERETYNHTNSGVLKHTHKGTHAQTQSHERTHTYTHCRPWLLMHGALRLCLILATLVRTASWPSITFTVVRIPGTTSKSRCPQCSLCYSSFPQCFLCYSSLFIARILYYYTLLVASYWLLSELLIFVTQAVRPRAIMQRTSYHLQHSVCVRYGSC